MVWSQAKWLFKWKNTQQLREGERGVLGYGTDRHIHRTGDVRERKKLLLVIFNDDSKSDLTRHD